ncbi:MAG TPA: ATP-binding cassette domain-containing protein [Acidimicrobiales bacterium]|nr:ATP-binding cassette domain-containing protein [Acidimicrobiales bacterium]
MLELVDLHRRFGDVVALAGLSLQARPGRLVGFLGPNGAGKTTAMRSVFHLVEPDSGSVRWRGEPVTPEVRLRFGYMPEQRGLYPKMTCRSQLGWFGRIHGLGPADADRAATRWLDELGLADRADHAVETLSHGNQQRVQLAAALVHDPELLVLDEPFSGLDPLGVAAMERVLRREAERGRSIVFSSHQLDLVESLCDDVVIVHRGRDVLAGTIDELRAASDHRRVDIRFSSPDVGWQPDGDDVEVLHAGRGRLRALLRTDRDPRAVLAAATDAGEVTAFAWQPPSLSDLFIEAVGRADGALDPAELADVRPVEVDEPASEMAPR